MKTSKAKTRDGYLVFDPELRFTPGGHAVCTLYLGTFEQAQSLEPDYRELEQWVLWREAAEKAAEELCRGARITIRGSRKIDEWVDRETGELRTRVSWTAAGYENQ